MATLATTTRLHRPLQHLPPPSILFSVCQPATAGRLQHIYVLPAAYSTPIRRAAHSTAATAPYTICDHSVIVPHVRYRCIFSLRSQVLY